ncbi:MAG: DUF4268 domain-containing protein [Acidimicrobiales bacterium]|nr:DUF4268 domain-containing protein [Acidimicrobiales bacterium]
MAIERIRRVPLREVWPHEAHNFTTWLAQNLDVLNDDLGIDLDNSTVQREVSAGAFNVDLVVEDENGETVVIENQLGRSDHDHLGKILTYVAALDASVAVWIVGEPRPEHVRAVSWLNDSSPISFYLFKIEAIRIGDSPAAPLLTLIVGPSEEGKEIASVKREQSERHHARRAFFDALLTHARGVTDLHAGRSPSSGPYVAGSSGQPGVNLKYGVTQHGTSVIVWIDRGPQWPGWNEAVYEHLLSRRSEIESAFGAPLEWHAKEGNRSRKLIHLIDKGGWQDEDRWPEAISATVDAMVRLEAAIRPHLAEAAKRATAALDKAAIADS